MEERMIQILANVVHGLVKKEKLKKNLRIRMSCKQKLIEKLQQKQQLNIRMQTKVRRQHMTKL